MDSSLSPAWLCCTNDVRRQRHYRIVALAAASAAFDMAGVRTRARSVVTDGVVEGYFLSTYWVRKLGMQTTGNAGGWHNLALGSRHTRSNDRFDAMLKKLGTDLLVTELMGDRVNYVTGGYSRGAAGFWVENGAVQYPVDEVLLTPSQASTLDTLRHITPLLPAVVLQGAVGTGKTRVLEQLAADLNGQFLPLADALDWLGGQKHPLRGEDTLRALLRDTLLDTDVVVVDDIDSATALARSRNAPRLEHISAVLKDCANEAAANDKHIVLGLTLETDTDTGFGGARSSQSALPDPRARRPRVALGPH